MFEGRGGAITVFGKTKITVIAPVGGGRRIGCSGLRRLVGRRVSNNASTVMVTNAAKRDTALAVRRRHSIVGTTVRFAGRHIPIITNANSGYAHATVRLSRRTRRTKTSKLLVIAPCCGGTARTNLVDRCSRVTSDAGYPVVVCGIPKHAKYGLLPRAITRLIHAGDGLMKLGRTAKGLTRTSGAVTLASKGLSLCSNRSNLIMPLVSVNTINIVSM